MKDIYGNTIYARAVEDGFLLVTENGIVTRFEENQMVVYPAGSSLSSHYEHPEGIVLSATDVEKCGIEME